MHLQSLQNRYYSFQLSCSLRKCLNTHQLLCSSTVRANKLRLLCSPTVLSLQSAWANEPSDTKWNSSHRTSYQAGAEPRRNIRCWNTEGSSRDDNRSSWPLRKLQDFRGALCSRTQPWKCVCVAPQLPNYSPSPRIWNKVTVPGRPQVKASLSHLPFNSPRRLLFLLQLFT